MLSSKIKIILLQMSRMLKLQLSLHITNIFEEKTFNILIMLKWEVVLNVNSFGYKWVY